ncbi:diaminopimelate epimerase [candidate division BRC1 bacterium HGW-BRC1-1]|nr:MAG: diaminopimelate epimerase [candidate division BRC1 bacterium HGW-BRC1-1]
MKLEFWKLTGAGNDFVALDNRDGHIIETGRKERIAKWCRRGLSIGADGVLLIEPSTTADFRMRYYNSDGSEGETCGNGSRCIARFAHMLGVADKQMSFETMAGLYHAEILGDEVLVDMTPATGLRPAANFDDKAFRGEVTFLNTGVPHAVVFVEDEESTNVTGIGRHLRFHEAFRPAGTNVNFIRVEDPANIIIRTYERGVENETLACGTGSIASAVVAAHAGIAQSPVRLHTRGGETLTIHFDLTPEGATNIKLQGGARVVYKGFMEDAES